MTLQQRGQGGAAPLFLTTRSDGDEARQLPASGEGELYLPYGAISRVPEMAHVVT
jgi:hypothetical protein